MNQQTLILQLQKLGELRCQRQALESQEAELVRAVRGRMAEHGVETIRSAGFEARLVEQQRITVDPKRFRKAVTNAEFMRAITVSTTEARKFVGEERLRRIGQIITSVQLRVAPRNDVTTRRAADVASNESAA